MRVRPRRRRALRPVRRVRRWLRRQDRFTRSLLGALVALSVLIVALIIPRVQDQGAGQRTPRSAPREADPRTSRPIAVPNQPRPPLAARKPIEQRTAAPPRPAPAASGPRAAGMVAGPAAPPRVAIVIDDLGQNLPPLQQLIALEMPLTVAVLPGLPASARTVREASRHGLEILVHQPMEPHARGGKDPVEGVLLTSMSAEAVRELVRADIASVPGAVGLNNHMGSKFTEDPAGLGALMAELRERGLFWLDSRTTPASHATEVARSMGVPAIDRDFFLDAEPGADFARGQLKKLVNRARVRGFAVGIGHPHPETIAALRDFRAELLLSDVALVPLSYLVHVVPEASPATAVLAAAAGKDRDGSVPGKQRAPTP